jgi:serine/threonine-protein kinase HipA
MPPNRSAFAPDAGQAIFGYIGHSAPDIWGRRLMQRAERRRVVIEGQFVRSRSEVDYLLGVSDVSRLGTLRFRKAGDTVFRTTAGARRPADD